MAQEPFLVTPLGLEPKREKERQTVGRPPEGVAHREALRQASAQVPGFGKLRKPDLPLIYFVATLVWLAYGCGPGQRKREGWMVFGKWGGLTTALFILLGIDGFWIATSNEAGSLRMQWLSTVILLVTLCIVAGYLVNTRIDGILIDDRNRISLERMQWSVWLIVLFSGYFVEAVWNGSHGSNFPNMQEELLALLGIISGSPVLSSMITDTKKQGTVVGTQTQVSQQLAEGDTPTRIGVMDANKDSGEASWADLYLGEEVADRYVVDISRLQKVVITVLLVVIYAGWLWHDFGNAPAAGFSQMPPVGDTFVWLLGISHASYLASKAVPKRPAERTLQS